MEGVQSKNVSVTVNNPNYVVVGDYNTTVIKEKGYYGNPNEENGIIKVSSVKAVSVLPKKPYHKYKKRIDELDDMTKKFKVSASPIGEPAVTTLFLTGPPGSGKTQLARQFGEKFLSEPLYEGNPSLVFTLTADSAKSLLQSLPDVIDQLPTSTKLPKKKESYNEIDLVQIYLKQLRAFLRAYSGRWLLILDDMRQGEKVNGLFPQPGSCEWGKGMILVTSQDNSLAPACCSHSNVHRVKDMTEDEAKDLLQQISGVQADDSAGEVAKELEFMPLSLACAATCVGQMKQDRRYATLLWNKFLVYFRKQNGKLLYTTFQNNNYVYSNSMVVVSRLAADRMADRDVVLQRAFYLLSFCGFSPVPLDVILGYVKANLCQDDIDDLELKGRIARCSLLIHSVLGSASVESMSLHQVMWNTFRQIREDKEAGLDEDKRKKNFFDMVRCVNTSLERILEEPRRPCNLALQRLLSPHLEFFVAHANSKRWGMCKDFVVLSVNVAQCFYNISGVTNNQRVTYLLDAMKVAKQLQLVDTIMYCRLLEVLGLHYRELHQLEESEAILKDALSIINNKAEEEWLSLKSSVLNILSWTYKLLRKLEYAIDVMEKSIHITRKVHGVGQDSQIAERLGTLAFLHRDRCEMEKAKAKVDEARKIIEKVMDDSLHKTPEVYCQSGKIYLCCAYSELDPTKREELLKSSLNFHNKALKMYEDLYETNDHLEIAGVLITHAAVLKELGDFMLAMASVERAEKIYTNVQHEIGLSFALCYKADILFASGEDQKANCILSESPGSKFLLASLLLRKRNFRKAKEMFRTFLQDIELSTKLLPTHRWKEEAKVSMAKCDCEMNKIRPTFYFPVGQATLVLFIVVLVGYFVTKNL